MATTLTLFPALPWPGKTTSIKLTLGNGGNAARVWCISAPAGSELARRKQGMARVEVFADYVTTPWSFLPDKPGSYLFWIQELSKGSAGAGGYAGAPGGATTETPIGQPEPIVLHVGQRMRRRFGYGADTADLIVHVWGDRIEQTTVATHGEATPAIVASSLKARAAAEMLDPSALIGATAVSIIGDLRGQALDFIAKFDAHLLQSGVHPNNDSDNAVSAVNKSARTVADLCALIRDCRAAYTRHIKNDDGTGPGAAEYHYFADLTNTLLDVQPANLETASQAMADLWRAYEAHRLMVDEDSIVYPHVHEDADTTNVLDPLPTVQSMAAEFAERLASMETDTSLTDNSGAVRLAFAGGFLEG